MNSIIAKQYPLFEQYQALRGMLMDTLSDEDLAFRVTGAPTLGELCKEIGEIEHSYIQGFKQLKQDFEYRNMDTEIVTSVEKLKAWHKALDTELKEVLAGFTQDDVDNKKIDRDGWEVAPNINLSIYSEALLIFYGKAWVYLHAIGKEIPEKWQEWIG